MKDYSNCQGHLTEMAAMPIYGKNLNKSYVSSFGLNFSTKRLMTLKLGKWPWVLEYYQVCSNDDPGLTLTYFTAGSNLVSYAFEWEKCKTMDFSETIVVYDVKVGICN